MMKIMYLRNKKELENFITEYEVEKFNAPGSNRTFEDGGIYAILKGGLFVLIQKIGKTYYVREA